MDATFQAYFDSLRMELTSTIWDRILFTISTSIQIYNGALKQRKKIKQAYKIYS